jgi:hypothetical protein
MIRCNFGGRLLPCGKRAEYVTQLVEETGTYVSNSMWIVCDEHLALWQARDRGESGEERGPKKPLPKGWRRETARVLHEDT